MTLASVRATGKPVVATTSFDAPDGLSERRGSFGAQRAVVSQEVHSRLLERYEPFGRGTSTPAM
jgi:hypothetical protein